MRILFIILLPITIWMAACNNDGPWAVSVHLTPESTQVKAGKSHGFSANVVGVKSSDVTWSVLEGPTGGTITQQGVYTAPLTPNVYHVVATSVAFPSERGIATVTVTFPSGALDPGFGTGGVAAIPVGQASQANGLVIDSDGKLLAAGSTTGANVDIALVRLNSDGTLDTTFAPSAGGRPTFDFSASDIASALALQSDGKIIVAGSSISAGNTDFALMRLDSDGSLDPTFDGSVNGNGKITTDFNLLADAALAVAIQPDGKIIAAGFSVNPSGSDFALARYNQNGTLDTTFGIALTGKVTDDLGGNDSARVLALQGDGKIVVGGFAFTGTNSEFALERYAADGTLDSTFGTGGIVITPIGIGNAQIASLALQPDGKIIAAGSASNGLNDDFALVRYDDKGTLDPTFGTGGIVTTDFSGGNDDANALRIQSDGKIVVAGSASNGTDDFGLARYNADGTIDTTFGTGGKIVTSFGSGSDAAMAMVLQTDGQIVAAGRASTTTGNVFSFARYWP